MVQKQPGAAAEEFGRRVRERRKELGLSQLDLGHQSEVHFSFISNVERGKRNPTLRTIVRLANALDVDPGDLMRGLTE